MTPSGASQVWNKLSDTSAPGTLANTWLLAPGVSYAFRNGHLQIGPRRVTWEEFDQAAAEEGASRAPVSTVHLPDRARNYSLAGALSIERGLLVPHNATLSRTL